MSVIDKINEIKEAVALKYNTTAVDKEGWTDDVIYEAIRGLSDNIMDFKLNVKLGDQMNEFFQEIEERFEDIFGNEFEGKEVK